VTIVTVDSGGVPGLDANRPRAAGFRTSMGEAMALSRDEVTTGLLAELEGFAELVGGLDPAEWGQPSRCAGWTVADVAAHVTGSLADVVGGRLDGLGTPEVTAREVDERRGRTPGELAEELVQATKGAADLAALFDDAAWAAPAPGGFDGTLGRGVEAIWFDTYVHGDDVRAALGRASVGGPGLRASVHHVAWELGRRGWGPAVLALDGIEEVPVGEGSSRRVTGDPLAFVLAATGRADPTTIGLDANVNIYG